MLKKTVSYEDFNGNQVQEDLYFNLSKSEIVDMEMSAEGPMSERLDRIKKSNDTTAMYRQIRDIVLAAYGVRSEDGRRFLKSDQIRDDFAASAAFDEFFFDLFQDTDRIVDFINGIIPAKAIEEALSQRDKNKIQLDPEQDEALRNYQTMTQTAIREPEEPKGEDKGTFGQPIEKKDLSPEEMREKLKEAGLLDN